jgi:hypothetical protein
MRESTQPSPVPALQLKPTDSTPEVSAARVLHQTVEPLRSKDAYRGRSSLLPGTNHRLKSMPRNAPQAVSRAPPGQNWKARNPLLPPVGQQLAKSRSPVDRDGSF